PTLHSPLFPYTTLFRSFYVEGGQEYLLRAVGRARGLEDIANTVVTVRGGQPITVGQLAEVKVGPRIKRGEGSANGEPAVILAVLDRKSTRLNSSHDQIS